VNLDVHVRVKAGDFSLDARFHAPAGITALFGPSGSGKSLTLRCVAGLTRPDFGRIVLGGTTLFDREAKIDLPTRSRNLGVLFQQHVLFPHLSVEANVGFGLTALPRGERRERVAEILDRVGMGAFGNRSPRDLSGGEQQRVALARALAPQPQVLLLDEPFSALDQELRLRLLDQLREVHARTGVPMLLVTHDPQEVRRLAGWVVRYDRGRVVDEGPPELTLRSQESQGL